MTGEILEERAHIGAEVEDLARPAVLDSLGVPFVGRVRGRLPGLREHRPGPIAFGALRRPECLEPARLQRLSETRCQVDRERQQGAAIVGEAAWRLRSTARVGLDDHLEIFAAHRDPRSVPETREREPQGLAEREALDQRAREAGHGLDHIEAKPELPGEADIDDLVVRHRAQAPALVVLPEGDEARRDLPSFGPLSLLDRAF